MTEIIAQAKHDAHDIGAADNRLITRYDAAGPFVRIAGKKWYVSGQPPQLFGKVSGLLFGGLEELDHGPG